MHCVDLSQRPAHPADFLVPAAARARERALAAHRKDEELDEEEDEGSTLVSEETNPMLDGESRVESLTPTPRVAADHLVASTSQRTATN